MLKIALGIIIGMTITAAAQIYKIPSGQNYFVCVPPWPVTDAFGVTHPYPPQEQPENR